MFLLFIFLMADKKCFAKNRKEWREWLRKNHRKENKVILVTYKKHTKKPSISRQDAMDEAICFGWIDTVVKRIDSEKYSRSFVKRKKTANWSKATQKYARRLINEGRMSAAGLKAYKDGLRKPVLDHNLPKNPKTPEDLKKELEKSKKAGDFFYSLAPSYRRTYLYWIEKAKLEKTRKKRIKEVMSRCRENKKPNDP